MVVKTSAAGGYNIRGYNMCFGSEIQISKWESFVTKIRTRLDVSYVGN